MKAYTVEYRLNSMASEVKRISFLARNKEEAYDIATYEKIPAKEGRVPYASWVSSVTYQNGNYKRFNTFAGKPY